MVGWLVGALTIHFFNDQLRMYDNNEKVRAMITVMDFNSEGEGFITQYTPLVNPFERNMLECVDGKSESECRTDVEDSTFECIMHFLGRSAYYQDSKGFDQWVTENEESSGTPTAHELSKALLTWDNYGTWGEDELPPKASREPLTVDVRYFYELYL